MPVPTPLGSAIRVVCGLGLGSAPHIAYTHRLTRPPAGFHAIARGLTLSSGESGVIGTFRNRSESEVLPVVKLRVRSGESIQEAVRRFRKLCERSGLRKEMRRKAYYEKPSERRRREELKRLRKARQAARV